MENFATTTEFKLTDADGNVTEIFIPVNTQLQAQRVSGDWGAVIANRPLARIGNNKVMLGDLQIKKLKGEE